MSRWTKPNVAQTVSLLALALAGTVVVPCQRLAAQAFDSTAMPSLELLAMEVGRASRTLGIREVAPTLLCEPSHPLLDSASLAACSVLVPTRAPAIIAAFARGAEVPLGAPADSNDAGVLAACPPGLDRSGGPRVLRARISAPVVGVYERRWEGRLLLEMRCRSPGAGADGVRMLAREYLYQWSGRAWEMYQHSWLRSEE
jgi:hypothetical protein